jgi:polysaccharide deacetylase 2 family uncharacterized protein YibQ
MGKNRKLFFAWRVFLCVIALFAIATGVYNNFRSKHSFGYHYRILVDKDLVMENDDRSQECERESEKKENPDTEFYEQTKYGYLPKISPKGESVFDKYSACATINSQKELGVIVLVDERNKSSIKTKLNNQKVTFVIPHHIDRLEDLVQTIREDGHEFFVQMPTQASVQENKESAVSPFLANDNLDNTLDKLLRLLASTKYALGVANVTTTLFTKSARDMEAVMDVLAKRGLAFFDAERSNDLVKNIAQQCNLIHICPTHIFEAPEFDITKLKDGDILMIRSEHLEDFIKNLPRNWVLISASASMRKSHAAI